MGQVYQEIDDRLRAFIEAQHMFFVATAPLAAGAHINLSPKGLDSLRILGPRALAYLDYVGSGAETIGHLRENGRIVMMWCAFEGPPKIVRVHGRGAALEPGDPGYAALRDLFSSSISGRAVITIDVERVSDSCGFGVPLYSFESDRAQLAAWAVRKGDAGLLDYQRDKNRVTVDGLPALRLAGAAGVDRDRP
jgi:hypothetical protein